MWKRQWKRTEDFCVRGDIGLGSLKKNRKFNRTSS